MKTFHYILVVTFLLGIKVDVNSQIISHDFNSSNDGWTTSDNWIRNSSSFGGNATNEWHCNPYNNYSSNQSEYVTSGSMDLSGFETMTVSIDIAYKTNNNDGFRLEYNANDGGGWIVLGTNADANWYTDGDVNSLGGTNDGWGDNRQTSPHWSAFTHTLPSACENNSNVQFRFYFASNGSSQDDGVAFDDFVITGSAIVPATPLGKDGPGGIGDIDGSGDMVLWLDANQTVATSGNDVTQWNDQSGYANHCTPPAVSNRPTFNSSGTNSHPVITFNGTTDYLTASDDNSLDLSNWSILIVGIINTHKNYNAFVVKGADAVENYEFLTNYPSTGNIHYPMKYSGGRSGDAEPNETFSNTVYGVYQLDYDQSNFEVHINGEQTETDGETNVPTTNSSDLYICNEQGTGTSRVANASVGEIIIYNSPLNTAQRYIIHNAMAAKYGFSMNANSLYDEDDSGYDYDVAGIGQASDGSNHVDAQGTGIIRMHTPSALGDDEFLMWGHNNGDLNSFGIIDLPLTIQSRLARVWRASETGEVGTTTVTVDLSSVAGSVTASDLRLIADANGIFALGSTLISGATSLGSNVYQWTGVDIDNNDYFTVGSINSTQTPLPVELKEFKATPNVVENSVDLFWITSSEINNDYFTVEKTTDLESFEEVVQVVGQGTTNQETEYHEKDYNPSEGISYYRLSQTDFDGKTEYFDLEKVLFDLENKSNDLHVELYPNPNNGHNMYMKIPNSSAEELNVLVNDFIGKTYLVDFTVINQGEYSVVAIEMSQKLAAGSYMINVAVAGVNHSHKLIVK